MDQINHNTSQQSSGSGSTDLPNPENIPAPDALLPAVLARLGLTNTHAPLRSSSVEALVAALDDPAWQERARAVRTLGERRIATESLMPLLHDPAWQVRIAAIQALEALGGLGGGRSIDPLINALSDEDASVRAAAIGALGRSGERAPLEPLLAALQDPEWLVREVAAMMLGKLGKRVPISPLMAAAHDENPFVREAAERALAQAHPEVAPCGHTGEPLPATRRQRVVRLITGGLAALLVMASLLFAWLPRVQYLQPPALEQHPSAAHAGAILFTYQGGQGVEGSPVWPSASNYMALLSSFGYSVQVWNPATGNLTQNSLLPVPYAGPGTASGWSWSPDGSYLAVTSEDLTNGDAAVQVWNAVTGRNTLTVHSHANGILYTSWSPDGARIALSGADGTVQVWDALSGQKLLAFAGYPGQGHRLFWSADGQLLLVSSPGGTFQLWNSFLGVNISHFRTEPSALFELSPDGQRIVLMDNEGELHVWNTVTGRELIMYSGLTGGVSFLQWSPESRRILIANDSEVQIWDTTGQTILAFPNPTASSTWQPSLEGRRVFTANDSELQIWDAITGHTILAFPDLSSSGAWQLSPDGEYFAFGSWNNGIQVWDTVTRRMIVSSQGHIGRVQVLAWSPDSRLIAFASADGTVQVWNVVTGKNIVRYQGLFQAVSLTWSPDGKLIAATSRDNTVQVLQAT